jgi:hypothetical protein
LGEIESMKNKRLPLLQFIKILLFFQMDWIWVLISEGELEPIVEI